MERRIQRARNFYNDLFIKNSTRSMTQNITQPAGPSGSNAKNIPNKQKMTPKPCECSTIEFLHELKSVTKG